MRSARIKMSRAQWKEAVRTHRGVVDAHGDRYLTANGRPQLVRVTR